MMTAAGNGLHLGQIGNLGRLCSLDRGAVARLSRIIRTPQARAE